MKHNKKRSQKKSSFRLKQIHNSSGTIGTSQNEVDTIEEVPLLNNPSTLNFIESFHTPPENYGNFDPTQRKSQATLNQMELSLPSQYMHGGYSKSNINQLVQKINDTRDRLTQLNQSIQRSE